MTYYKYIYKVLRKDNWNYDQYDSAIVVADNEKQAMLIPPDYDSEIAESYMSSNDYIAECGIPDYWNPDNLNIELIGMTNKYNKPITLLASFNMG